MCGINGLIGSGLSGIVQNMNKVCAHRGPDGDGVYENLGEGVCLAHVRLAILDLAESGQQPMIANNNQGVLVYNGELYNYKRLKADLVSKGYVFKSSGDTEVLLYGLVEYGEEFLKKMQGIFAFAFWSPLAKTLLIARDHVGVKPLYYSELPTGELIFSSEIKAFYAHPGFEPLPDFRGIQQHLAFGHCSIDRTALAGVRRLSPGHILKWRDGVYTIERYWRPNYNMAQSASFDQEAERLADTIDHAVNHQLISDVPVGALLSGGLDSSLITEISARTLGANLRCYTSSYDKSQNRLDQSAEDGPYARRFAGELGLSIDELMLTPNVADLLPYIVYHMDEPLSDPAAIACYLLSKSASEDGAKVLLSGQGADELFSGYPRYRAMHLTRVFDHMPAPVKSAVSRWSQGIPGAVEGDFGALLRRGKRVLQDINKPPASRFLSYCSSTPQPHISAILSKDVLDELEKTEYQDDCMDYMNDQDLVGHNCFRNRDFSIYLPNHNLLYADKMGMAVGVETRVPLLDLSVVEAAMQYPYNWLVNRASDKLILRRAARGSVPAYIIDRPKAGFGAPYRKWLRYDLEELWEDITSRTSIQSRGWFNYDAIKKIRKFSQTGTVDLYMLQWSIITLELWSRQFLDKDWPSLSRLATASPGGL